MKLVDFALVVLLVPLWWWYGAHCKARRSCGLLRIHCGVGAQGFTIETTNHSYVCLEWRTNAVGEISGSVVTNHW